jgi:hypothetical protein
MYGMRCAIKVVPSLGFSSNFSRETIQLKAAGSSGTDTVIYPLYLNVDPETNIHTSTREFA